MWQVDPVTTFKQETAVLRFSDRTQLGALTSDYLEEFLGSPAAEKLIESVNKLTAPYLEKLQNYFGINFEQQEVSSSFTWEAFRDFGLGVLYDPCPPRANNRHMHVMDGGLNSYARWHRFNWIRGILQSHAQVNGSI
jgi:hypothetical protein